MSALRHDVKVHAYCFMPDHVHLLVEGGDATVLPDFVKDFKQRTGYAFRRLKAHLLWQKSYHDHILRSEEAILDVARYIVGNPVRAGLVIEASAHPYTGSFVWDRSAVLEA